MFLCILLVLSCFAGFILFSGVRLGKEEATPLHTHNVSVIIPARNEECNLPHLLESLKSQTVTPQEIIVVDDCSLDKTGEIAAAYGARVIEGTEPPLHWTGKNWALWNGFLQSTGDVLVFFDADVRLAPKALEQLLAAREKCGGVISAVPYHYMEKAYEKLSLIVYLLGVFAFTSPFEKRNAKKGLYGSCVVVSRKDYEKVNGHQSVSEEVLDDLNLGRKFTEAGIPIENYTGGGLVSFRMYPGGIASELQGFGKGAINSTSSLRPSTVLMIAVWLIGLFAAGFIAPVLLIANHEWALHFGIGYLLYAIQILFFTKSTGRYGLVIPVLHIISSLFFLIILLYSIYQVAFVGSVTWKGRQIKVKGRREL